MSEQEGEPFTPEHYQKVYNWALETDETTRRQALGNATEAIREAQTMLIAKRELSPEVAARLGSVSRLLAGYIRQVRGPRFSDHFKPPRL